MQQKSDRLKDFLQYNKVSTGISGLDKLLYDGLVVPYMPEDNLLIVIRGEDNTEKTVFSLQLLQAVARAFNSCGNETKINYYTNYLSSSYVYDLQLDLLITSAIKRMHELSVTGKRITGSEFTSTFFEMNTFASNVQGNNRLAGLFPLDSLKDNPDGMLCDEALYYNNRTDALHIRLRNTNTNGSDSQNAVYERKYAKINDYIDNDCEKVNDIEKILGMKFIATTIPDDDLDIQGIYDRINQHEKNSYNVVGVNLVNRNGGIAVTDGDKLAPNIGDLMKAMREHFKVCVLIVRNDVIFPIEQADLVFDLATKEYEVYEYLLNIISIYKSRHQLTARGTHQYKRRDHGIEVYPSTNVYCMQRRYLQRALIYTHSNVLTDTYQQYLDNNADGSVNYDTYIQNVDSIANGYFNALSPSAYKNFSLLQVMDRVFLNPHKPVSVEGSDDSTIQGTVEKDFLYGHNGGVTAIIGSPNSFKRFLTFGSAFGSAFRKEHTLFLLLNKDDKIVRRRLQCPARKDKCQPDMCRGCYEYLHFMNIMLGCITPEELLFYLIQQIDTSYPDGKIRRIIIDDLQIVDYCFPLLRQDTLFLPALVDECRNRNIALYILCDKYSEMTGSLRALADNVVCTEQMDDGNMQIYVERYAGYNSKPCKIFAASISHIEDLFECYERGSRDNRHTHYDFNADVINEKKVYTLAKYWNLKEGSDV